MCILLLTLAIEVIYYRDNRKKTSYNQLATVLKTSRLLIIQGSNPSIKNGAVCSKQPFLLGTLAQLSRTVR